MAKMRLILKASIVHPLGINVKHEYSTCIVDVPDEAIKVGFNMCNPLEYEVIGGEWIDREPKQLKKINVHNT